MDNSRAAEELRSGSCVLGIEFGSTRIKSIVIGSDRAPLALGIHEWQNDLVDGIWTYSVENVMKGLSSSYLDLKNDIRRKYGVTVTSFRAIGISAMMHGYMAFDRDENLLAPFRTWRNTITEEESKELTEILGFHIPQRWTACHFLKDLKAGLPYLGKLDHVSTLSGYVNARLTGTHTIGINDASGMFPIDMDTMDWVAPYVDSFNERYLSSRGMDFRSIFPKVLRAGETAGHLTEEGALLLDPEGDLRAGIPCCPPEGDAGTGMIATNTTRKKTGCVSAGTSAFTMVILEKPLSKVYPELDILNTPDGSLVAMSHTNNCTESYDRWFSLFDEVLKTMGVEVRKSELYDALLHRALEGRADCGGLLSYNFIAGEPIVGVQNGKPLSVRDNDAPLSLPEFIRAELYASVVGMRFGMDILKEKEGVTVDCIYGHGGFFKTADVGARIMATVLGCPVKTLSSAGEGGAWGIALLADYMEHRDMSLADYLDSCVFTGDGGDAVVPSDEETEGFLRYYGSYRKGLGLERDEINGIF